MSTPAGWHHRIRVGTPPPRDRWGHLLVVGCGRERAHVSADLQRELPCQQYIAHDELCPDRSLSPRGRERLRALGRAHARALVVALKRNPDALMRTAYASSDEGPGEEDLSVREVAAQWVADSRCAPLVRRRLQRALGS